MASLPEYHVLDFFIDDRGSCALTIFARDTRYHVIVDHDRLKGDLKADHQILQEYRSLTKQSKHEQEVEAGGEEDDTEKDVDTKESPASTSHDSGIDLPTTEKGESSGDESPGDDSPTEELQEWILRPLAKALNEAGKRETLRTVQDWYNCQVKFYQLAAKKDKLVAEEDESCEELEQRMTALIPDMPLPKYLRELQIDMIHASDVVVVTESTELGPIHPAVVEVKGSRYFLKNIDMSQTQSFKREIHTMKRIEKKGLHKEMRVPLVRGLVRFEGKRNSIMGFLMDIINDPKPLTHMLDPEVPQDKRDAWAQESERMVKLLHDNDIIWGDSKADNFMVDADDNLWIIDFGGSYTDGWVDPELKDTKEGDDMGIAKTSNALHDPEANTFDPNEEDKTKSSAEKSTQAPTGSNGKRKRNPLFVTNTAAGTEAEEEPTSKRTKST